MELSDILSSLGRKLHTLRKEKGLRISDVAKALDVSDTMVGGVERATGCPSIPGLFRLSQFYQVPLAYLFEDDMYMYHRSVGNLLQKQMAAKSLTIPDLAREADINYFTLVDFFNGRATLELDQFKSLAVILDVAIEQIIPEIARYVCLIRFYLKTVGLDNATILTIEDYIYSKLNE